MKEMNEKELPKLRRGGLFVVALVLQDCYFLRQNSKCIQ